MKNGKVNHGSDQHDDAGVKRECLMGNNTTTDKKEYIERWQEYTRELYTLAFVNDTDVELEVKCAVDKIMHIIIPKVADIKFRAR